MKLRLVLVSALMLESSLLAQNSRSAVSVTGSDANPCTVPQPCRTFGAAMAVTNPGAEILALDSGGYGPFNINKSVTIRAIPGAYAGIAPSSGSAITISAGPFDVVTISGLALNSTGATYGINVSQVGTLFVDRTEVTGFSSVGIWFGSSGSSELYVNDSTFRNNSGSCCASLMLIPAGYSKISLDHVRIESGYIGVLAREYSIVTIRDSEFVGNTADAVFAGALPASTYVSVDVIGSVLSNNGWGFNAGGSGSTYMGNAFGSISDSLVSGNSNSGISASGNGTIRVSTTTITRNPYGVLGSVSSPVISFGNNRLAGNTVSNGAFNQTVGMQ